MSSEPSRLDALRQTLVGLRSVAVAFSGGADSTLLLATAHEALGDKAIAVTIRSCAFPTSETEAAVRFCRDRGIRHEVMDFDLLSIPRFAENPSDRCYHCKRAIFASICDFARFQGIANVIEGSNLDDDGDYRPGRKAIAELGVKRALCWKRDSQRAMYENVCGSLGLMSGASLRRRALPRASLMVGRLRAKD